MKGVKLYDGRNIIPNADYSIEKCYKIYNKINAHF